MKKRLFSLLLVLTLCFTLLPYSAAAEGGEETSVTVPKGSKITAPESPAPGCEDGKYYFVHWTAHPLSDASSDAWNFAKDTVESSMTLRAVWYQYAEMHEKVSLRGKPYAGALVEYRDRAGSVVYTLKASGTDGNCTDYVCERTKPGEYDLYIDGNSSRRGAVLHLRSLPRRFRKHAETDAQGRGQRLHVLRLDSRAGGGFRSV